MVRKGGPVSFSSLDVSGEMLGMTENYPNIQRNVFLSLDSKPLIKKFMVLLLLYLYAMHKVSIMVN